MAVLTVFLAPDGPAGGVRDVLQDLSGVGLVGSFLWVADSAVRDASTAQSRVDVVAVDGGRLHRTTVQEVVTGSHHERVRLCVLVPLVGGATTVAAESEERLALLIASSADDAALTRVRCLLTRQGGTGDKDVAARMGWHNVLIAPEDAKGPGQAHELLPASADPVDLGRHAAPAVAGLLGLWTGTGRSHLDDLPVPPDQQVRAVRCFYRRVDAAIVEVRLRARVLATGPVLPLPRDHGSTTVHIDDAARACQTMAQALWAKHRNVLQGPRVYPTQQPPKPMGWRTALRWLWGFVVAALRNAPEQWYAAKVNEFSSASAAAAQETVFGRAPAAYTVIVNGMTPQGEPVGWQEVGEASAYLDEDLLVGPAERGQHRAPVDLSAVWKDYAGGALTLVDAGDRGGPTMPPAQVGPSRGVLRSAAAAVPAGDGDLTVEPGHLAAVTGTRSVQVGDVLGAELLRVRLEGLARDPARSLDAGRALQAFADWRGHHDGTYVVQVGKVLAERLPATAAEIREYFRMLQEMAAPDDRGPAKPRQRAVARTARILTGLAVVGLVTTVALAGFERIAVVAAAVLGVLVVLAWLAGSLINFVRGQRELFRELNRRRTLLAQEDAVRWNLREAIKDLRGLSDAYGQFLLWSRVLGAVLQEPFGTAPPSTATAAHISRGLPLSTAVARARENEGALAEVAAALRSSLFTSGWLSRPWAATLAGAARLLGPRGEELAGSPENLFAQPAARGSLLQEWSALLARDRGFAIANGDAAWTTMMGRLDAPAAAGQDHRGLATTLLASVQGLDQPSNGPGMELAEFLSGVDQPGSRAAGQRFDSAHFSPEAQSAERTGVDISDGRMLRSGLSRTAVLVQFSSATWAWDFAVCASGPDGPEPQDPEPIPEYPAF